MIMIPDGASPATPPRFLVAVCVLGVCLLGTALPAFAQARVSVLCYHAFRDTPKKNDPYGFTLEELASHIAQLKNEGVRFVSASDVIGGRITGNNNVLVTVDDGHRSVLEAYRRVFRPNGIRPLLAIYPNIIGKKEYALTWEQLSELAANGCDVAAHGYYHLKINQKLFDENPRDFRREIYGSKKMLEEGLKRNISLFVYPFGLKTDVAVRALKDAGYRYAFTIRRGGVKVPVPLGDSAFELPRYMVTRGGWQSCFSQVMKNAKGTEALSLAEDRAVKKTARTYAGRTRPDERGALHARLTDTAATGGDYAPGSAYKKVKGPDLTGKKKVETTRAAATPAAPDVPHREEGRASRNIEYPAPPRHVVGTAFASPVQRVATGARPDILYERGIATGGDRMSGPDAPTAYGGAERRDGDDAVNLPLRAGSGGVPAPHSALIKRYREIQRQSYAVYERLIGVARGRIDRIKREIRNYVVKNF